MEARIDAAPHPFTAPVPHGFASAAAAKLWLSERFATETDPDRLLDIALEAMGRHLRVSRVAYGELDDALEWMNVPRDWTDGTVPGRTGRRAIEADSSFARHYRAGRTLVVADTATATLETDQVAELESEGIRSVVGVPLVEGGRLVAVFNATHTAPRAWTEDEIVLFAQTGARIWGALQHLRTLERLREGEEQFRTLAENMPGLCWLGDARGKPFWGNRRAVAFFSGAGRGTGEMAWVVHPDDHHRVASAWRTARETGTALELTTRVRGADGAYRPFLASGSPIHDAGGRVIRWCGVLVDLSAQEADDRRTAFLRAFSDATRDETDAYRILSTLGEMTMRHLVATQVALSEVTADAAVFDVFLARAERPPVELPGAFRFGTGFEALHARFARGETLVTAGYDDSAKEITAAVIEAGRLAEVCAAITVPLVKEGRLVAMLTVSDAGARRWTAEDVRLVEELAERVWTQVSRARAEAALAERERNQAFLIDWSDAVRSLAEPPAIIETTLAWLGRHLRADRITYAECDTAEHRFTVDGEWRDGVASLLGTSFLLESVGSAVDDAWRAGEVVRYDDVEGDPRLEEAARDRYRNRQIGAFVSVPLVHGGGMRAALSVQSVGSRTWAGREVDLLRDVAERLWVALERAQGQAALRERERNQAFLISWNDAVREEASPRAILALTLDRLGTYLGASRINYGESDREGKRFEVLHEWRDDGMGSVVGYSFAFADLGERVHAAHVSGRPVVVDDTATDPMFDETNLPLYESIGMKALLAIPLVRGGRLEATLSIQQTRPRAWAASEVQLVADVADRTWSVLERARSEERMAASEAQLSAFMENAPVAMHLKNADGRYVRVNPQFARGLGLQRDEVQGTHPSELFPPDIALELERLERIAVAGEVARAEIAMESMIEGAHMLAMAFPVSGGGGQVRTGGFTLDLTERKQAEAALARSREMLYQTEKLSALGSLLAGVSHELNNPLSIVVAQSVMMERQAGGGAMAERAQKIRKAADRCARIVQTFLAMARQRRPERTATDLSATAAAALELTAYGLKTEGIAIASDFAAGLPLIFADADQLHQIILNLLVNAQHAMTNAPERVLTVRTARGTTAGTVVLEVADTGGGVPAHIRRRIFEPFFTTKPQGQGTGVGLSFSQGLAEAHGGRLELVPTTAGARFRLTLPIEAGAIHPVAAPEAAAMIETPVRRALVVDDEREIAEALADFLSIEGFACDIAEGGAAAQVELAHGAYDLIVSDLRMPGVGGPELYAWLVCERPDLVPRIGFATGDTLGTAAARFLAEAKRPVLEKPFMPDAVRRFLQQMDLP